MAALEADAEELVALRIAAMRESLERIGRFDPERARDRFLSTYAPQPTRHIVQDGKRIGFVVVKPEGGGLLLTTCTSFWNTKVWESAVVFQQVFNAADERGQYVRAGALKKKRFKPFLCSTRI